MFNQCPKRFHALRVAKTHKAEDNEASLDGTRKHKSLEDRLKDGTPLPPELAKHEDKCVAILNSGMTVKPEEELAITRSLEPCDWWHKDVFLRVKADVSLYGKSKAALMDWKTGKRKPKPFQLELGALTQFIHYPEIKSTRAAFLWLKDDVSDTETYTREDDYDRILVDLHKKVDRVEAALDDDVWPAKPSWLCNYCELKDECSYSQANNRRR
jgi:hypothetical protein